MLFFKLIHYIIFIHTLMNIKTKISRPTVIFYNVIMSEIAKFGIATMGFDNNAVIHMEAQVVNSKSGHYNVIGYFMVMFTKAH